MSYFYEFLENESKELAHILYELEDEIYTKPQYMLTHSRAFIELLMDKVMMNEKLTKGISYTILSQIQVLADNDLLTDEVENALHKVRRLGNVAAHDTRKFRYSESLLAWEQLYIIVKWFVEVYQSYDIIVPEYIDPVIREEETDTNTNELENMASRFEKIEELIKQSLNNDQSKDIKVESTHLHENETKKFKTEETTLNNKTNPSTQKTHIVPSNDKVMEVESKDNELTNDEQLWNHLNKLRVNQSQILAYHDINKAVLESPTKFVTLLDGLFLRLSKDRMKDLAEYYQMEKLSETYFLMDKLSYGWDLIRTQLNGTLEEYKAAQNFIKISEIKFKRDLTEKEVRQALENLLDIATIWNNGKEPSEELSHDQNINQQEDNIASQEENISQSIQSDSYQENEKTTQLQRDSYQENEKTTQLQRDSSKENEKESQFIKRLNVLRTSSQESVVHADSFGSFRKYMHVERPIQHEFEKVLTDIKQYDEPQLILLCGSVGDGKSHLLAYMKEEKQELMSNVIDHNDSTESFNPQENSLDTLEYVLDNFDDHQSKSNKQHTVIAINLGVLHNFYTRQRKQKRFNALCDFIDSTGVFDSSRVTVKHENNFHMLNFAEEQPYLLTEQGAESPFFMELMEKVTKPNTENPFYNAWKSDKEKGYQSIVHENYLLLQNKTVQESIVQSLIESIIKQKVFISTRAFYNFVYEILLPVSLETESLGGIFYIEDMLPNLMYSHPDRSKLLEALHQNDPLKLRSKEIDQLTTEFVLASSPRLFIEEKLGEKSLLGAWKDVDDEFNQKQKEYVSLLIRNYELMYKNAYDEYYQEYIWYLYSYYKGNADELGKLFELIEDVIFKWNGSPKANYIYINPVTDMFRLSVEIQIEPEVDEYIFGSVNEDKISRFTPSINIGFSQNSQKFLFELDYELFVLLKKISKGYRPNLKGVQDALQFSEHHDELIKSADKTKKLLIVYSEDGSVLKIEEQPRFAKTKFRVEKVNEHGI